MNLLNICKEKTLKQQAPGFPLYLCAAGLSILRDKKKLGYGYNGFIYTYENELDSVHYNVKDITTIGNICAEKYNIDSSYFLNMKKKYEKNYRDSFMKLNNAKNLLEKLKYSINILADSVGYAHIIESISIYYDNHLRNMLLKVFNKKEIDNVISEITMPEAKSFMTEQEEDVKRIFSIKDKSKREKEIDKHLKKYSWIKNGYSGSYRLTKKDLVEQYKNIKDVEYAKRINHDYKISGEIKEIAELFKFLTIWQDERKINILKSIELLDKYLIEASKEWSVDFNLLKLLTPHELLNKNFEKVKERKDNFSIFFFFKEFENILVFSGDEARKYSELIDKKRNREVDVINGSSASRGKAIGKVSLCKTMKDISNFKKGRILVTSMTRPEFLPAMKKAVAIITDEGGITCHAAIVSRELGIPCVIGTKDATHILSENDLVEVLGDHGQVKVLR